MRPGSPGLFQSKRPNPHPCSLGPAHHAAAGSVAAMPGALPDGEPVPGDGALPESARLRLGRRPFGIYVHVPFCTTRCGYCDFNTYTAAELGGGPSASLATYPALAISEIGLAR